MTTTTKLTPPTFDSVVEDSVREALTKVLGESVWKAVAFYFDTKTCAHDPEGFSKILDKLFGPGSKTLRKVITDTLLKKTGSQVAISQERDFHYWIQMAKTRFASSLSTSLAPTGQ